MINRSKSLSITLARFPPTTWPACRCLLFQHYQMNSENVDLALSNFNPTFYGPLNNGHEIIHGVVIGPIGSQSLTALPSGTPAALPPPRPLLCALGRRLGTRYGKLKVRSYKKNNAPIEFFSTHHTYDLHPRVVSKVTLLSVRLQYLAKL